MWLPLGRRDSEEPIMQTVKTIGLDITKPVFQIRGIDAEDNVIVRRQPKRCYVLAFFQECRRASLVSRPAYRRIIGRANSRRSAIPCA
jgi:hypothetical protein